jgi:tyrosyl-tRNA synthetase
MRRTEVEAGELHPKQAKVDLAKLIVRDFHGVEEAERAAADFERRFARKELLVEDMRAVTVSLGPEGSRRLASVIVESGLAISASEATRKIEQGGVRLDGIRLADAKARIDRSTAAFTLQVGRNAVRVVVVP